MASINHLTEEYEALFEREVTRESESRKHYEPSNPWWLFEFQKQINEELNALLAKKNVSQEKFESLKAV